MGDPLAPMYRGELQEFVNAILEDREPQITAEDGLRVLEITDAVFESGKTGKPIKFPLD